MPRFSDVLNRPLIGIYGSYVVLDVGEFIKIEKTSSDVFEAVPFVYIKKTVSLIIYE